MDSFINNVLLETYCGFGVNSKRYKRKPKYCKEGIGKPGYHCFEYNCPYKSYTLSNHTLCYTDKNGESRDPQNYIGFGGEMIPESSTCAMNDEFIELWTEICRNKIEEAYSEYMEQIADKIKR